MTMLNGSLPPMIVRASAGTGKTYQLTARLLQILHAGAAPETILATTFTRKAAGEILERILIELAVASEDGNSDALDKLQRRIGDSTLTHRDAAHLLVGVMRGVHRLRICTLDSLFSQLARSFAMELDLPPAWRLSDEIEELRYRAGAVAAMVGQLNASETSTLLAMLAKGDNKRSIARELIDVVSSTYALSRTAGHKGWTKIAAPKSPVDKDDVWDAVASDFQAAAEATANKRHRTKLTALSSTVADRDTDAIVGEGLIEKIGLSAAGMLPDFYGKPFDPPARAPLSFLYDLAKTEILGLLVGQNEATGRVLAMYADEIQRIKRDAAVLSFDDIAVRLATAINHIDRSTLTSRLDGSVDHLLLDEFQDTSPVQWSVLRSMAVHAADGDDRSFFCVGDTKQAIYGWRGGVAEIFDAVADHIDGVLASSLDESFRSSPVVTAAINDVFKNLTRHKIADGNEHPATMEHYESIAVRTFVGRFPTHCTARTELPGYFEFRTCPDVDGDADARRDAAYDAAANLIVDISQRCPGKSIGVLTRTNDAVAAMIQKLKAAGVDVSQEGGNPLVDSAAVERVLSALLMAEHPGDGRWAFHLSQGPLSIQCGWTAARVRRLVADQGLVQTVRELADAIAPACGPHDTLRLKQLVALAIAAEQNESPRLRDFVDMVRTKRIARPRQSAVRVMTVHQSKGLEFDAVVLPQISSDLVRVSSDPVADASDALSPPQGLSRYLSKSHWHFLSPRWRSAFGNQAAGKMTEALCLMYVAMTRARQALYLIAEPHAKMADKKTVAGLVAAALQCDESVGTGSAVLSQSGDQHWAVSK